MSCAPGACGLAESPAPRCLPEGPSPHSNARDAGGPEGSCPPAPDRRAADGAPRAVRGRGAGVVHGRGDPSVGATDSARARTARRLPQENKSGRGPLGKQIRARVPRNTNQGADPEEAQQFSPSPAKRGQGAGGWGPSARGRMPAVVHQPRFSSLREERAGRGRERGGPLSARSVPPPCGPYASSRLRSRSRRRSASGSGSRPMKRRYSSAGSSASPWLSTWSTKSRPASRLNSPSR